MNNEEQKRLNVLDYFKNNGSESLRIFKERKILCDQLVGRLIINPKSEKYLIPRVMMHDPDICSTPDVVTGVRFAIEGGYCDVTLFIDNKIIRTFRDITRDQIFRLGEIPISHSHKIEFKLTNIRDVKRFCTSITTKKKEGIIMGMFDRFYFEKGILPENKEEPDHEFQSKSLNCELDIYNIVGPGLLIKNDSSENVVEDIINETVIVYSHNWETNKYQEYKIIFINNKIEYIEKIKETSL